MNRLQDGIAVARKEAMKRTFLFVLLVSLFVVSGEASSVELSNLDTIGAKVQIAQSKKNQRIASNVPKRRNNRRMAQADPSASLVGEWTNQLGSKLNIKTVDASTGQITGTYKSPSGGGSSEFPLIGWVNHKQPIQGKDNVVVLSFSVRWGPIGSITAWAGYLRVVGGVPTITAQWFLVRPISDFPWDHVLTNQDVFRKT